MIQDNRLGLDRIHLNRRQAVTFQENSILSKSLKFQAQCLVNGARLNISKEPRPIPASYFKSFKK